MDPSAKRPVSPAPQMLDKGALKLEVTRSLVTGEPLRNYKNTQGGPERNVMALDGHGDLVFQGNAATARAALGVMQALCQGPKVTKRVKRSSS
ncbi:hypothetical protein FDECE_7638 [Fusarium decemcellulare]|nr:hypothetical protein FDECE_7638 [Fusarium decemcellulare]